MIRMKPSLGATKILLSPLAFHIRHAVTYIFVEALKGVREVRYDVGSCVRHRCLSRYSCLNWASQRSSSSC